MMCRADTATQQNETYSLCFGTAKVIQVFDLCNTLIRGLVLTVICFVLQR